MYIRTAHVSRIMLAKDLWNVEIFAGAYKNYMSPLEFHKYLRTTHIMRTTKAHKNYT